MANPTPSRNEPCSCGSGRRYKDCYGALLAPAQPAANPAQLIEDAYAALDRGDLPAAAVAARAIHAIDGEHSDAWHVLTTCALMREDFAEALECCDRAIAAQPDYAPYHVARGRALLGAKDVAAAEDAWRKALSFDAADPEADMGNVGDQSWRVGKLGAPIE